MPHPRAMLDASLLPTAWFSLPTVHREAYGNVSSNHICLTNYPPDLLSPNNHRVETIIVANTDNQAFQGIIYDSHTIQLLLQEVDSHK